jgi:hypothetical protein
MISLNVLIGCESSGIVRDAFIKRGHNAVSCDLQASERPGPHYQGNVLDICFDPVWDLFIVHPDCTYICSSGLHWNKRIPGRQLKTDAALDFVRTLMSVKIPYCLENPVGCIGTVIRPADQYIQPYQFGHDASKKTGLWLKGLPLLKPTRYIEPRMVNGRPRWGNQTDSGQNRLAPSADRWKERARTYQGIADAMADQWGNIRI